VGDGAILLQDEEGSYHIPLSFVKHNKNGLRSKP